ncbi:mediator complex, subunit Med4, partial [Gorgonomyces haynaldii]
DKRMQQLNKQVQEHQATVVRINSLKEEMIQLDTRVQTIVEQLMSEREQLDEIVQQAKKIQNTGHKIDTQMLLSYASRVAKHTLSPLNQNSWIIEPPIPQDNHMRMSLLFQQDKL